jgi:hypothetical protein
MPDIDNCLAIDRVELNKKTYWFKPEIILFPYSQDDNAGKSPLLIIDDPRLNICAIARNKKKLLHETKEQIKFLIDEYVLADPKNFSPGALQLRKNWLKIIKH